MEGTLALVIAATPAFIASSVEFVEATTIVLAVGTTRGWRAPLFGTLLAVLTLAVIVGVLGGALVTVVPEHVVQLLVGALLLLFGLRWLRKSLLRFAGIIALRDEELIYRREVRELKAQGLRRAEFDWVGMTIAYKTVLLEGIEVAFIVIALGAASAAALNAAIWGAAAAGVAVIVAAALLRRPLTMVPENWMKFVVGAMLVTFGVYWAAEGIGGEWGGAGVLFPIFAVVLAASWTAVRLLRVIVPHGAQVEARNV